MPVDRERFMSSTTITTITINSPGRDDRDGLQSMSDGQKAKRTNRIQAYGHDEIKKGQRNPTGNTIAA